MTAKTIEVVRIPKTTMREILRSLENLNESVHLMHFETKRHTGAECDICMAHGDVWLATDELRLAVDLKDGDGFLRNSLFHGGKQ